jgi:uncharacterized protein YfaS (alpha-2-macroglobulin family)
MEGYTMATPRAESKFYWCLPVLIFALSFTGAFAADLNPSKFEVLKGGKFYLLSEKTFSSQETAMVRFEGAPSDSAQNNGVDIRLYRIPSPIKFLESQKNLHRPSVAGKYQGEGIRNAVHFVWDVLYKKSRLVWQRLLSFNTRAKAVKANPAFTQLPAHKYNTVMENNPQFAFLPGLTVVQTFRYPLHYAAAIKPEDVKLSGSSSNFINANGKEGTIHVPFGKLAPGLYLVEGILGTYRANTLLFVSDTVAVTKVSSSELLTWTVDRTSGKVSPAVTLQVTDGLGKLGKGQTDSKGIYVLKKKDMERTYVFGEDKAGGVFVSENFYYDSEIYSHKLYVITDRPLYRPGESVFFRGLGRTFNDSIHSVALPAGEGQLKVFDPAGVVIWKKKIRMNDAGFFGSFSLPPTSVSGGYELNYAVNGVEYTSYIRVANFVKPHFEVEINASDKDIQLGAQTETSISLNYPNNTPVVGAEVEIIVRSQQLTMLEGQLEGLEIFPVELSAKKFKSDNKGVVKFQLPALKKASRLIIQVKATDDKSYRVNKSKELVISSDYGYFNLTTQKEISAPGEVVTFDVLISKATKVANLKDFHWELIRLEDQSKTQGEMSAAPVISVKFGKPGNYVLNVLNKDNLTVASKGHWVEGDGIGTVAGTITIVFDKEVYQPQETANFIINFSEEVDEALVTLERDRVEKWSLASSHENWLTLKKSGARSMQGSLKVEDLYAPNVTFSVVYVRKGKFVFENKGLKVAIPKIDIAYKFDKPRYLPGEKVNVEIKTSFKGRALASEMTLSVVDEMIYALQPEVAPAIFDFFYHLRRNQVKTSASLAFHSFDAAVSAVNLNEPDTSYEQRNLKVLKDRARREDKDTAYWNPSLKTDASGTARISFVMPDSITKWRVTGRAFAGNWNVGQKVDGLESYKDFYHTYVGPREFRKGDKPVINFVIFNNTGKDQSVDVKLNALGSKKVNVGRGPSYVSFEPAFNEEVDLRGEISQNGKVLDRLATQISIDQKAWMSEFVLAQGEKFPADAQDIKAHPFSAQSDKVMSVLDSLWDYPYGCVEQISSKLLPLSLAYVALEKSSASEEFLTRMERRIYEARSRLVRMAGEGAQFTWWGDQTAGNFLMKVYAFFADFHATRALDMKLSHWESLLEDYQTGSAELNFSHKVLALWMMDQMGLPVRTLLVGALENAPEAPTDSVMLAHSSLYLDHEIDANQWASGMILLDHMLKKNGSGVPQEKLQLAKENLKDTPYLIGQAVLAVSDPAYLEKNLNQMLEQSSDYEGPTFDRSMTLALLWRSLKISAQTPGAELPAPWLKKETRLGFPYWTHNGKAPEVLDQKTFKYTYQSSKDQKSTLPIKISRKFFKLKKIEEESQEKSDDQEFVQLDEYNSYVLDAEVTGEFISSELYVDQIVITTDKTYAFSILEVPLSSGMELETQTWGINLTEGKDELTLGRARPGPRENFYVVPLDKVSGTLTVYNLIRPGISGEFVMPPVRFHRMYSPNLMAFEGESKLDFKKITVR